MKRIYLALIAALLTLPLHSHAQEISNLRWDNYCKNNARLCQQAINICENYDGKISCDQIKASFIMKRPLPKLPGENPSEEKN